MIKNLGHTIAPPRFILFVAVFLAGLAVGIPALGLSRGTMAAFDVAAAVFLGAVSTLLGRGEAAQMRQAARENDANRAVLLGFSFVVLLVILVAVAKELQGKNDPLGIALALATIVLAWLFANTIYALHYAHLYYSPDPDNAAGKDCGGIDFPNCDEPDYWDFVYFSYTLGMTFQTSDVDITSRHIRKVVTGQCLAAFVFNLGVLAFTINVLGGG
ncbi:DUF1345 domain-containing protein [Sphingomonas oligophenolica]|uniref:DUF1345 domain-containing protein n=1 Tax=Sphingomonas oligophenolica TaxID=301154 RepID=A0A502CR96_9SPHN|nr:DUF1345 domain-containing protein [Sphingomonas oligophenolica]TPG15353.1 DUF1345 domain-containing protein [Sphingomonas oligophenolica]